MCSGLLLAPNAANTDLQPCMIVFSVRNTEGEVSSTRFTAKYRGSLATTRRTIFIMTVSNDKKFPGTKTIEYVFTVKYLSCPSCSSFEFDTGKALSSVHGCVGKLEIIGNRRSFERKKTCFQQEMILIP